MALNLPQSQGQTFGPAGKNHSPGLVPDPGSTAHSPAYLLGDDTNFHQGGLLTALAFLIDGGGAALATGVKGYVQVPFACTILSVTLLADQTGSCQVDIWKCTYAQFDAGSTHPVVGDSITASDKPTISSATKFTDSTLTGWTTTINAGDILAFDVVSDTTITRVTCILSLAKS